MSGPGPSSCCVCGHHETSFPALFLGRICSACESATKRSKPKPIPMSLSMRKYLKACDAGEINPFSSFSIRMEDGAEYSQSIKLTPTGKVQMSRAA